MRRLSRLFFTLSLTTLLPGWLCIAPILVFCTCVQGHQAYALTGHVEPACGHEEHGHAPAPSRQDSDRDEHEDEHVPFEGYLAPQGSAPLVLPPALICEVRILEPARLAAYVPELWLAVDGPPLGIYASIASTVLLI